MDKLSDIRDINTDTLEGKYLLMAIAKITTESQTDKTPNEVLEQVRYLHEATIITIGE